MAFMSLEVFFRKKLKCYLILHFFYFIYLLPNFIIQRLHNTISVLAESAIEYILMAIVWLYGFESVFCQILIDFLFVVFLLFFRCRIKNWRPAVLIPSLGELVIVHLWDILIYF